MNSTDLINQVGIGSVICFGLDDLVESLSRGADVVLMTEEALYAAAGLNYSPRQSLFTHVNELTLVADLPPCAEGSRATFVRWRILLGEGVNLRELMSINRQDPAAE